MRTIKAKLLASILGVSLGFSILIVLAALVQMYSAERTISEQGTRQADSMEKWTSEAMDEISNQTAMDFSAASVKYFDLVFENIHKNVKAVADKATELYAAEQRVGHMDENVGLVSGVRPEDVRREFEIIAPIRDYIKYMPEYDVDNLGRLDLYYMSESGMCLDGTETALGADYSDLRTEDWYQITKERGKSYWSSVFTGKISGKQKVICVEPVYDSNGRFMGCVAGDMEVASFQNILAEYDEAQIRSVLFFDTDGKLMHATNNYDNVENVQRYLGKTSLVADGDEVYSFSHLSETEWIVCVVLDQSKMQETVASMQTDISENAQQTSLVIKESTRRSVVTFAIIVTVAAVCVVILTSILAASISRPIHGMMEQVRIVGSGDLNQEITVSTKDEIGKLANEFNHMTGELRKMMDNIQNMAVESERIETELNVVRQIQLDMLPLQFPAFPERRDFDIYAMILSAREDGSNFYDFFLVDRTHLCLVIGDVSGTGIPATLLSVITRTHIKNYAKLGYQPGRILMETNNQICSGNESKNTVSVFLGLMDLENGMFSYVNAGAVVPLWKHSGSDFQKLKTNSSFALASMENVPYPQQSIRLMQGDMLFLHTEGVGAVCNSKGIEYTEEYLHSNLNRLMRTEYELKSILRAAWEDILIFCEDIPQKEDCTMLIFRYFG